MADTHLQVNADGTTATRKTELWPSSKNLQQEVLRSIFEQQNWKTTRIENISGSHWKVETACESFSWKLNLYISSIRDESRQPDEFKMQLGNSYPDSDEPGWVNLVLGIYTISDGINPVEYILSGYEVTRYDFSTNPSIRGTRTNGLQKAKIFGMFTTDKSVLFRPEFLYYYIETQAGKQLQEGIENAENQSDDEQLPLQQIFYGAPGTGKSHTVEQVCKQYKHHRTTFHPDSDYSTFVGCYKPTKENSKKEDIVLLDKNELAARLKEYRNLYDETQAQTQFGYDYYEHLRFRDDVNEILSLAAGKTFDTCIRVGMAIAERSTNKSVSSNITYSFVPQTFIQAYTDAWQNLNESVFLVIEEINRGNCAQIFGDLFQLLDRKDDGYSSYEIDADKDLQGYLCEFFAENGIDENAPEDIKLGKKLLLPPNLHIWATMNTSDQSLFPIDSAFKRRWDWKYVPIDEEKENWSIEVNGTLYSWSSFLKIINEKIYTKTNSEDKQLGFYFCKAKDGIISADKFVSKVLFYIYNDIFKDYGFDEDFFKDDEDNKTLSFRKYYDRSGNVNERQVEKFLKKLEVEIAGVKEVVDDEDPLPEVDEDGNNASSNTKDFTKYSINGTGSYSKGGVVYESMKLYVDNNPSKNAQEIVNDWLALGVNVPNFVETKAMFDARKQNSRDSRINEKAKIVTLPNGQTIYVSNQYNPERINELIAKVNAANWNINISKV